MITVNVRRLAISRWERGDCKWEKAGGGVSLRIVVMFCFLVYVAVICAFGAIC